MTTHRVAKGTMGVAMPPMVKGDKDRVLPGGLPPVPYRNHNAKLTGAYSKAAEPWNSKRIYMEIKNTRDELAWLDHDDDKAMAKDYNRTSKGRSYYA